MDTVQQLKKTWTSQPGKKQAAQQPQNCVHGHAHDITLMELWTLQHTHLAKHSQAHDVLQIVVAAPDLRRLDPGQQPLSSTGTRCLCKQDKTGCARV
eukprot:474568-Pelagomonas_calceolata.AAC.4